MKHIARMNKESVVKVWLFYYLIMLFVPLGISAYLYSHLCNAINDEIEYNSETSINFMAKNLEAQLMGAEKFYEDVYRIDDTVNIIKAMSKDGDLDMYTASSYIKTLKSQGSFGEYASGFIMYFEEYGKIISSVGYYDDEIFFNMYFPTYEEGFENWKKELLKNGKVFFKVGDPIQPKIYHSGKLYYPEEKKNRVTFLTEINNESVLANLDLLNGRGDEIYFVTDNSGELLWQIGGEYNCYEKLDNGSLKINDTEYVVNKAKFKYYGMNIYHAGERKIVFSRIIAAHRSMLICLVLCVLIGSLLIYIFTKSNYKEITKVLTLLDYNDKNGDFDDMNEIDIIKNEIIKQKEKNLEYKEILSRQHQQIVNYTAMRILKGANESIENLFVYQNSTPVSDRFSVAVLAMSDKKLMNVISGLIHDSLNESGNYVFCIDLEVCGAFIINCCDYSTDRIIEDFEYALIYARDTYGCGFTAVVSELCESVNQISIEYSRIRKLLQSLEISGDEGVFAGKKNNEEETNCYYYPIQTERQLINSINIGDTEKVHEIVEEIYYENFDKRSLGIELISCLLNNIAGTLINTINANRLTGDINPALIIRGLYGDMSVNEKKELILRAAGECSEAVRNEMKHKHSNRIDDILSYIHQNYADVEMNVFCVAEKFNMSSTVMSKLFKKEMGVGMLEYINMFRLNKAAKLLVSTNRPITEIAENVGCGNYRTFARLFAKRYGITAKQYREINR